MLSEKITDRGTMLCDSGLLSLVVALSLVLYVRHLGFYSDDWAFLAALDLPEDKSTSSLFVEMMVQHGLLMRPTQSLYLVLLYKLFGLEALGYHLVNAVIMIANAILFYLCLSKLRQPRLIALAVPWFTYCFRIIPRTGSGWQLFRCLSVWRSISSACTSI